MALGKLGQDVVADDGDRLAHVACGDPRDRGGDLSQRCDQLEPDRRPTDHADDDRDRKHEQEQACSDLWVHGSAGDEQDPEDAERDDGRREKGQGQAGLERQAETALVEAPIPKSAIGFGFGRWGHSRPAVSTVVATSR